MGIQSWRNLSVLLLAGVALVGCNSGPEKPKLFGGAPQNPANAGLANKNLQQPWLNKNEPFPTKQPANLTNLQQNQPNFGVNTPAPGPNNPGFTPVGGPLPVFKQLSSDPTQPGARTTQPVWAEDPTRPNTGLGGQPIPVPQPPPGWNK